MSGISKSNDNTVSSLIPFSHVDTNEIVTESLLTGQPEMVIMKIRA